MALSYHKIIVRGFARTEGASQRLKTKMSDFVNFLSLPNLLLLLGLCSDNFPGCLRQPGGLNKNATMTIWSYVTH